MWAPIGRDVSIHVRAHAHTYVFTHVCKGQRTLGVTTPGLSTVTPRQCLSLGSGACELSWGRWCGSWASRIVHLHSTWHRAWLFTWVLGNAIRFSCSCGPHFTNWAIAPALDLVLRSFDRAWLWYFGPVPEPSHTSGSHCQVGMIKISYYV